MQLTLGNTTTETGLAVTSTLATIVNVNDVSAFDFFAATVTNTGGGQINQAVLQGFKEDTWTTIDSSAVTTALGTINPDGSASYTTTRGQLGYDKFRVRLKSTANTTATVALTPYALGSQVAASGDTATAITTDTISEATAATGVTVDGVLLKDGGVSGAGAIAMTLATASSSTTTGAITTAGGVGIAKELFVSTTTPASISATGVLSVTNATNASSSTTGSVKVTGGVGVAKALYVGTNVYAVKQLHITNIGTTPVGTVAIVEYANGRDVTTELTLTNFIVGALAGAAAALRLGNIVYAFPAGQHFELAYSLSSIVLTAAGTAVAAVDTGLGSVIATGVGATLDGTATFEDRLTGQTFATASGGGAAGSFLKTTTAGIGTGIALNVAASVKDVFLNAAATWNADNTGNLTASGVIVLKWTKM